MKRDDFKQRLKDIGINQKIFASVTGYGYSTVKGWKTIPRWAGIVLDCLDILMQLDTIDDALKSFQGINSKVQQLDFSKLQKKGRTYE